ncbi:MBL fold metallo-hydrolase [Amycolatopsis suaedae]|uniref:MBL fold metallo-hydrolase n=1 Tax=Amycolatopsis suaedae TaxID=2510978 RepID=A0A4Q7IWM5_9PSEU|nr:MBL fold metallo-hydrolase [Amycolatopsis suaedae]RZQ59330.1 MBL fold metallo-hydrolase [Amycolatopsis suaedae]
MRLTILGCSGSVPGPNSPASGYLIEADGFVLGLEFGNGVLAALQAERDPFDLDALLLSHLHPDHCADVTALTVLRRYHPAPPYDRRPVRLPLYAPVDAPWRLANAYAPNPAERETTDLSDTYDFATLTTGSLRIGPFTVTAAEVAHPTEAFGLRIEHGGSILAYSGDTGPCATLDDLARDADVLLCEASWTDAADRPADVHLSGVQAGELARRAGAKRLLLTHIAPWTDRAAILAEARGVVGDRAELAERGSVYQF